MALRVTQPFDGHAIGDLITDVSAAADILASDQAAFVVTVADPAPADPAPKLTQE